MKKLMLTAAVFLLGAGVLAPQAQAKSAPSNTDTDTLMMDHKVLELGDKYVAILSSMYQEEATRAGTLGYHSELQERDVQAQLTRKETLISLQNALNRINAQTLSPYTKVDYYILKELVNEKLFAIETENELAKNPLWYLEAVDAIYDILLKDYASQSERQRDALKRVQSLPQILEEGKLNIDNPPDLYLRLAIEKAQLAYNSFNNVNFMLTKISPDEYNKDQTKKACAAAQSALKDYAAFLKEMMMKKEYADFRLGEENYAKLFNDVYQQDMSLSKLKKVLDKELETNKEELIKALTPIIEPTLTEEEKAARTDQKGVITIFPQDYYKAVSTYTANPGEKKLLDSYADAFKKATVFFADKKIFPAGALQVVIAPAPKYLANKLTPVSYIPPFPLLNKQMGDILITMPKAEDKALMAERFNYGMIKFDVLEYITPGKNLMYSISTEEGRVLRKLSNDPFFINGWVKYVLNLAGETEYFSTQQDKLNLAWFNYTKALLAVAEYNMQTMAANYTQTVDYLVENGMKQEEAEANTDYLALNPLDAAAYILGAQEFKALKEKYAKKINKKSTWADYHKKLLSIGRVPMTTLDEAVAKAMEEKKVESFFNMTYF